MRFRVAASLISSALLANTATADSPSGNGTGFIVNDEGWVLTNAHVLEGCSRIRVTSHGDATEWIADRQNDLAALKLPAAKGGPFLRFRSSPPRLGEDVVALGYPLSGVLSDTVKVTVGNINSLVGLDNDTRYLQVSTPLQPGNSGGPIVDRSGAVVGIATSLLGASFIRATDILPQNVNFAVRSHVAELFLQSRGIPYVTADPAPPRNTADLSEQVAQAVVQILCFEDQSVSAAAESPNKKEPQASAKPHVSPATTAILYEERTTSSQGSASIGSAQWNIVLGPPTKNSGAEPIVQAEATFASGDLHLRLAFRRNRDVTLPASHILELSFATSQDFEGGSIASVHGILLKQTEQEPGQRLFGVTAKISDGFFLMALSAVPQEMEANMRLLKAQRWLDIPITYETGRRAVLTLDRGTPGEQAILRALEAWGDAPIAKAPD